MGKNYLFSYTSKPEIELDEFFAVSDEDKSHSYLVSNIRDVNTEVYAPEINFYFRNSEDTVEEKIKNIKILYNARSAEYDYAQDLELTSEIGSKVLICSTDDQNELESELKEIGFDSIVIDPQNIIETKGYIGNFRLEVKKNKGIERINTDQIIWFNAPEYLKGRKGIYDPSSGELENIVDEVRITCGDLHFRKFVKYDPSICLHHGKREDVCGKCIKVCAGKAIVKEFDPRQVTISHVDCNGCGKCVSVCPAGALDYTRMPKAAFRRIASLYRDKIVLLIPRRMGIEDLQIRLRENVLPLTVESEEFLDESHFLTLLQTTGYPIVLYADVVTDVTENIIDIINGIFRKKYGRQAIFIYTAENEPGEIFDTISSLENCRYDIDENGLNKREIVSMRLARLVGKDELGTLATGPYIHYGNLKINQDKCTLCLSCADACSLGALTVHTRDNSLRFNPSLCASCSYCELTCPEPHCMQIINDQLSLNPGYFRHNVVAKDSLFKCKLCEKEFAPAKSIAKIADIMTPLFGDDKLRIETLYCCPDCKVKVMLESGINNNEKQFGL